MSIMWKYLDKRNATVSAIRDYDAMKFIVENTDEKIREEQDSMAGVASPKLDDMPRIHNNNANEERILNGIEKIDLLKERYRQAVEYMAWFQPAWDHLSDDERYCLHEFYMGDEESQRLARFTVADQFGIDEDTSVYKKKNRALDHLKKLLFGLE